VEREHRLQVAYDKQVGPQLAQLHRRLGEFGLQSVTGLASVKFAAPAAIAGALTGQPVVAGAAGLIGGLLPYVADRRKKLAEIAAPSAASYLWRLEEELGADSLWASVVTNARRFCFGM
jgi:hypothetical protein